MAREIERKFKVISSQLPELTNGESFSQGYISDHPQVRFRLQGQRVVLAIKKEISPGVRVEFEFPRDDMQPDEILDLLQLAKDPPLAKTRYTIPYADLEWTIDVYDEKNKGLIVAEVELPAIDHPIDFPPWIDQNREITHDWRYGNINLTRSPYQDWKDREV